MPSTFSQVPNTGDAQTISLQGVPVQPFEEAAKPLHDVLPDLAPQLVACRMLIAQNRDRIPAEVRDAI